MDFCMFSHIYNREAVIRTRKNCGIGKKGNKEITKWERDVNAIVSEEMN